jgi:Ca-activated chloride channel family protein
VLFRSLIDTFKQDKIGIVVFAGEAFIQCPLTLDRGAIKLFLSTVNPALVQLQGTSLSKGIQVASEAFSKENKGNKVIILLTDGEDHEGAAIEVAKTAKKDGIHIFTVGIGTPEGRTIPDDLGKQGVKKDRAGKVIISKLNEDILKQIAKESDGAYYRSTRGDLEVIAMERSVRQMTQKSFSKDKSYEYEENYQFVLLAGLIILMLEMLLSERKWRRE